MRTRKQKQLNFHDFEMKEDFRVFHYLDDFDFHSPFHHHSFYELYFLIQGKLSYQIKDTVFSLQKGDVLLVDAQQKHRPLFGEHRTKYERLVLRIPPSVLESLSSPESDLRLCFEHSYPLLRLPIEMQHSIRFLLTKLLGENDAKGFGSDLIYKAYLTEIFVMLGRWCQETAVSMLSSGKKGQIVEVINQYIDEHIERSLTVEELAAHVYLSKYYFMRMFKEATGATVHRYILQKKLAHACNDMRKGASASAAAEGAGFSDYSSFYRAFKKEFGYSPIHYIKNAY